MNRIVFVSSVALAFAAGAAATHLLPQARAATDMAPQVIHVPDLSGDALGMASGTGMRSSRPGVLRAEGRVVQRNRRVAFCAADLYDLGGELLASSRCTQIIR